MDRGELIVSCNLIMSKTLNKIYRVYKYSLVLFTIVYWVYVIIDDYNFIIKYWNSSWLMYLGIWFMYYIAYLVVFISCFWFPLAVVVLIYYKLIKPRTCYNP